MSTVWTIIIIVLLVILAAMVAIYFYGKKLQGRQAEQQAVLEQQKMTVSMLIIDKKKMKLSDTSLSKQISDKVPFYAKLMKYPVVKVKVGPKVLTMLADPQVFELLPVKAECKVTVSGIYITELKSIRGQSIPKLQKKQNIITKLRNKVSSK